MWHVIARKTSALQRGETFTKWGSLGQWTRGGYGGLAYVPCFPHCIIAGLMPPTVWRWPEGPKVTNSGLTTVLSRVSLRSVRKVAMMASLSAKPGRRSTVTRQTSPCLWRDPRNSNSFLLEPSVADGWRILRDRCEDVASKAKPGTKKLKEKESVQQRTCHLGILLQPCWQKDSTS